MHVDSRSGGQDQAGARGGGGTHRRSIPAAALLDSSPEFGVSGVPGLKSIGGLARDDQHNMGKPPVHLGRGFLGSDRARHGEGRRWVVTLVGVRSASHSGAEMCVQKSRGACARHGQAYAGVVRGSAAL